MLLSADTGIVDITKIDIKNSATNLATFFEVNFFTLSPPYFELIFKILMLYMTKYQVFTNIQSFKSIIPKFSFINKQNKIKN
ncbi:hypothetical protein CE91St50_17790 [Clostridioides difficile]|nr:hypothetical protein CE91St50_17790 [Clostridioides difficile]